MDKGGDIVFSVLDWVVVAAVLVLLVLIGRWTARTNKTQSDYILGGKKMSSSLVGVSLFAALFSSISYISYPGEMIKWGPVFLGGVLAFPVAGLLVGKFIIPKLLAQNVSSAYEILEVKLGPGSRTLATVFFLALRFMWMCTVVYATVKVALVPLISIPETLVPLVSIILVFVSVVYTTMGGLKAVLWTDALHSSIMLIGAILTIIVVLCTLPSFEGFKNTELYANWTDWDWMPRMNKRMTVANVFLMSLFWQICTASSDQMAIQRYISTGNARSAAKSYWVSLASSGLIQVLLAIVGLMVMVWFSAYPEKMLSGTTVFGDADSLFPRFVLVGLPRGVTGLIAAAIMAAAMSSLSSGLNSSATVIQEDIIKKSKAFRNKSFTLTSIKLISAVLGVVVMCSCFLVGYVQGNLFDVTVKVVNLVVAPLAVLFFMALFVPKATDIGTVVGGLSALAIAILIAFFQLFGITHLWVMPISLFVGMGVGIPVSRIHLIMKQQ